MTIGFWHPRPDDPRRYRPGGPVPLDPGGQYLRQHVARERRWADAAADAWQRDGPGEINVRLAVGWMVIAPGKLIIGDDDGLLCVPRLEADGEGEEQRGGEAVGGDQGGRQRPGLG
jgi:hypothetical protein